MISNLIQPPNAKATAEKSSTVQNAATTAQNCAGLFVNSMGEAQRTRFKKMLESGVPCGQSVAQSYGVPLNEFISEVKKII